MIHQHGDKVEEFLQQHYNRGFKDAIEMGAAHNKQHHPRFTSVRAKMTCGSIEHWPASSKVKLGAVYSDKGENADFCKATPSGECWMQISNGVPAQGFFEPGKSYYVTFTESLE